MTFTQLGRDGDVVDASIVYTLGSRSWEQRFAAVDVDDVMLESDAAAAGLSVVEAITDDGTWVRLRLPQD
jgi:hypothetical protein